MHIVETYLYELQPVNQAKNTIIFFHPIISQDLTVTPKIEKLPKIIFGKIKADAPEPYPHAILEGKQQVKSDIRRAI